MSAPAVVIAASNLMPSLRERLADDGEFLTFADTEPIQALQAILEQRPSLIVLERLFAATPRGAALINRIKNRSAARARRSPRDVAHRRLRRGRSRSHSRRRTAPIAGAPSRAPSATTSGSSPKRRGRGLAADRRRVRSTGTARGGRRAIRIRPGVEIQLDGNPGAASSISRMVGAQVSLATILRPNQKVRVSIPNDDFVMRFRGAIAWAKFELPQARASRRATAPASSSPTPTPPRWTLLPAAQGASKRSPRSI